MQLQRRCANGRLLCTQVRHQAAERKQRLLEPDEKQSEANRYKHETDEDLVKDGWTDISQRIRDFHNWLDDASFVIHLHDRDQPGVFR